MVDRATGGYVDIFPLNVSNVDARGRLLVVTHHPFELSLVEPPSNITLRGVNFLAPNQVEAYLHTQYTTLAPIPRWLPAGLYNGMKWGAT